MNFKKAKKFYMFAIAAAVIVAITASLAYYFAYAWFAKNNAVTASGMIASLNADVGMEFDKTVTAVHYKLSGDKITYTYSVGDSGSLSLTKTETINSTGTEKIAFDLSTSKVTISTSSTSSDGETTWTEKTTVTATTGSDSYGSYYTYTIDSDTTSTYTHYLINSILPDEFIDVTIGFKLTDESLIKNDEDEYNKYSVSLTDFGTDDNNTFYLKQDGKDKTDVKYGVLPAFKWGIPTGTVTYDTTDGAWTGDETKYTTFHGNYSSEDDTDTKDDETKCGFYWYAQEGNDDGDYSVEIASDKWTEKNTSEYVSLTFRIKEDFTEYYKLFSDSTLHADYSNYLSEKIMSIGQIRLSTKEATS